MRIHTRGCHPITQKSTVSTYATSTVTLLDNYQLFENDYTPYDSINYNLTNSTEKQTSLSLPRQTNHVPDYKLDINKQLDKYIRCF